MTHADRSAGDRKGQSTNRTLGPPKRAAWQRASGGLAVALLAATLPASGEQASVGRRADLISAARAIMHASPRAALITVDAAGRAQARTMDAAPPNDEMVVWLATNPRSTKVDEIRRNPSVTLYYSIPMPHVSLLGRATVGTPEAGTALAKQWDAFTRVDRTRSIQVVPEQLNRGHRARHEGNPETWPPQCASNRSRRTRRSAEAR
jgi:hypothetical protein